MRKLYFLVLFLATSYQLSKAQTCATPGKDGAGGSITGIVNTYYPGTGSVLAGSTSISVGAPVGAAQGITSGDLLLVIQIQDASINSTNSIVYGDGSTGSGATSQNSAGLYEYVFATAPVSAGSVTIFGRGATHGLINPYNSSPATALKGQSSFQVIRVPQYSSASLTSGLTAPYWNGATGGILAIDVSGVLNLNSATVSLVGRGFRGGGGRQLSGGGVATNVDYVNPSSVSIHGSKAEGTAGTPRYVYDLVSAATLNTGFEGYPNGSFARGAPGNAGGGGTDDDVTTNSENSGGGGGANQGSGGKGGNTWSTNQALGGLGGAAHSASSGQIFLGGGGGAGSRNNGVAYQSSGGPGGGIVLIRTGSVSGAASIDVSGGKGITPANDGGGGGGAGGSISFTTVTGSLAGLTGLANGANGTDAEAGGTNDPHGPGGGGGGGFIYSSAVLGTSTAAFGVNGTTQTTPIAYGSLPGTVGKITTNSIISVIPGIQSGAECLTPTLPSPVADKISTVAGTPVTLPSVTSNDIAGSYAIDASKVDLDPSTAGVQATFTVPGKGTYTADASGNVVFTPLAGFSGVASTPYLIQDTYGNVSLSSAPLTVTVYPRAVPDTYTVPAGTPAVLNILANDLGNLDPATVAVTTAPSHGTLALNAATGAETYTPAPGYAGGDTFSYTICDKSTPVLCSTPALVTISVAPAIPPSPVTDNATTVSGTAVTLPLVTSNDTPGTYAIDASKVDLDPSTAGVQTAFTVTGKGTYAANASGNVVFTPVSGYSGVASTPYLIQDTYGNVSLSSALLTVTVKPVAVPDTYTSVPSGTATVLPILTNDLGNLDPSSVTVTTAPSHGTLALNAATGAETYTPAAGYAGGDTFSYTVCDKSTPALCSQPAAVTITVTPATPPTPVADNATTVAGTAVTLPLVTSNDTPGTYAIDASKVDLDPSTAGVQTAFTVPGKGTYTADASGNVLFTPLAGFSGVASTPYLIQDTYGNVSLSSALLTVTVYPRAVPDMYTVPSGTPAVLNILANDLGNLDPSTVTITTAPSHGTLALNTTTGAETYTPAAGYAGGDTFSYTVCDKSTPVLCSLAAAVTITVAPATPPSPVADNATLVSGTAVTLPLVTSNDTPGTYAIDASKVDLDPSTAGVQASFTVPGKGTYTADASGNVVFTPLAGFSGVASTPYLIQDTYGNVSLSSAPLTVTVYPRAVPDTYTVPAGTPAVLNILANDLGNLDPATVAVTTAPSHGTLALNAATGAETYTPAAGYAGGDTFSYTICDKSTPVLCSTPALVTITVAPPIPPSPVADNATTVSGTAVTLPLVTSNDTPGTYAIDASKVDLDPSTAGVQTAFTVTGKGTYAANASGNVVFTPVSGYSGVASTPYLIQDTYGNVSLSSALLTVTVKPVAVPDTYTSVPSGTATVLPILTNDLGNLDPSSVTVTTAPSHGTLALNAATGAETYTPAAGYAGGDTFSYTVCDKSTPALCSQPAAVTITVTPATPPTPVADNATTVAGTAVTLPLVTSNDTPGTYAIDASKVDLDPSTAGVQTAFTVPGKGTYTADASGNVLFTPLAGFSGVASTPYLIQDTYGNVSLSSALLTVTVYPRAVPDMYTVPSGTPAVLNILANDLGNLDPSTVTITTAPSHGTLALNTTTGAETYTPAAGYAGGDTFSYTVCDKSTPVLCSLAAAVTITVAPATPPSPVADNATLVSGTAVTLPLVTSNDTPGTYAIDASKVDLDPSTAGVQASFTVPGKGTYTADASGNVVFTPLAGFSGVASTPYLIQDTYGNVSLSSAPLTVTVYPRAVPDTYTVPAGTPAVLNILANDLGNLDPATVAVTTAPSHGTLALNAATGAETYTPAAGYAGGDTFSYTICDKSTPALCSLAAAVTITVAPPIPPAADLSITITAPPTVSDGGPVLYMITLTNKGPNTAHTITVTNPLPSGTIINTGSLSTTPGSGTLPRQATYSAATNTVTLNLDSLIANGSTTITYSVTPAMLGTLLNSVKVTGTEQDPQANNNQSSATTIYDFTALVFPTLFTPTGTSNNNEFVIKGLEFYPQNSIEIFNRWGNQVYRMTAYGVNNTWWDGSRLNDGTYYYVLRFTAGNSEKIKGGYITIKRK